MSKSIYTFNIEKKAEVEEKRIETYVEDGVEKQRTITEKVEKVIPIEILLKEPNRKQVQEAELVFSVEMSKSIKLGILTKNMLLNKYKDTGGLDGEKETKALSQAYADYQQVQIDIVNLRIIPDAEKTEDQVKELQQKENRMLELRKEIDNLDEKVLTILIERMKIAQKIGTIKSAQNSTIYQAKRWLELKERNVENAKK